MARLIRAVRCGSPHASASARSSTAADLYDQGVLPIEIPLTQEDLAEIAGVTRPTANRVLKKEQERGSIKLSRGVITVVAKERLKGRAR